MSTARERERARDEARESRHAFRDDFMGWGNESDAYDDGFVAGRTVTAEQIEQAARALGREDDARHGVYSTDEYRDIARVAFTAAGFIVEEDA